MPVLKFRCGQVCPQYASTAYLPEPERQPALPVPVPIGDAVRRYPQPYAEELPLPQGGGNSHRGGLPLRKAGLPLVVLTVPVVRQIIKGKECFFRKRFLEQGRDEQGAFAKYARCSEKIAVKAVFATGQAVQKNLGAEGKGQSGHGHAHARKNRADTE